MEDIKLYIAGRLKPYDRKAFFFSGHEMNVAAFARALELDEPIIPLYGSTIILETLRDKKKKDRSHRVCVCVYLSIIIE